MNHFRLVIKGDSDMAKAALESHSIPFATDAVRNVGPHRSIATVDYTAGNDAKVREWFTEDSDVVKPFPGGTLLYFQRID